jgi:hypothetical protein
VFQPLNQAPATETPVLQLIRYGEHMHTNSHVPAHTSSAHCEQKISIAAASLSVP